MKQRYSSLDVRIIAHELSKALLTLRVQNIYDISAKTFLIKFSKIDTKQQLLVENGLRCHLTGYARTTAASPSIFVQKLRKVLKTRRVTRVSQIGTDRIMEIQFSDGQYKLFLEFYAGGNVILTDEEHKILTLLRIVHESEGQEELRVGLRYILDNKQDFGGTLPLTIERLRNALQNEISRENDIQETKKKSNKKPSHLKKILALYFTEFPPILVDYALKATEFDQNLSPLDILHDGTNIENLMRSLKFGQKKVEEITTSDLTKGYIIAKKKPGYDDNSDELHSRRFLVYDDFQPFKPFQLKNDPAIVILEIEGFNKTVDEFFYSIEDQKLETRIEERELTAQLKIEAVRQEQTKRLEGLQKIQTTNERKAGAIQANIERVNEAIDAVNGLIAQGMDWVEIEKLVEVEQRRKNSVALSIKLPLKLHENTITLTLDETVSDNGNYLDSDNGTDDLETSEEDIDNIEPKSKTTPPKLEIDIDLGISPWANARLYFEERRTAIHKEERTMRSSAVALKSQEAKIRSTLKNNLSKEKAILRPVRQQLWFEKYTWFLSSDRYLVLAGKDDLQNEVLYKKRYLKRSDVYVNANINGAAIVVIKNKRNSLDAPIPPSTLTEAGTLAVVCSSAWESKAPMSAWWVKAEQVSKTGLTGEVLPTGCFHIQGEKNFLPPSALLFGFGVLFKVSDESKFRHMKHRIQDEGSGEISAMEIRHDSVTVLSNLLPKSQIKSSELRNPSASETMKSHYQLQSEEVAAGNDDEKVESNHELIENPEKIVTEINTHQQFSLGPTEFEVEVNGGVKDGVKVEDEVNSGVEDRAENLVEGKDEIKGTGGTFTAVTDCTKPNKSVQMKRGKKGKAKKIATKYKDQDLEDRIAAQKILGAVAGQQKAHAEAAEKAAREAKLRFQKERRKAQHEKNQKETLENEELRKRQIEGEIDDDESSDEKYMMLDNLFGKPIKGDEIVDAIPVCAPLTSMKDYKYKVKIQPGTTKKGKVAKEILSRWLLDGEKKEKVDTHSEDDERIWPRELELLKGWKFEEIIGVIPISKMRIVMASQNPNAGKGKGKGNEKQG